MIEIRPAQPQDKESIISFCKNTFAWGDYLPDVWDDWMVQGDLLIATYNSIPVGVAHIDYLSDREAWFEGLRVHPDYRRVGVAQALSKAGFERAKQKGIEVGRALIAGENIASQTLSAANGFAKVADMHFWAGEFSYTPDPELKVRAATPNDLPQISLFLGQFIDPVYLWRNWRFVSNTPDNLNKLLQDCELYMCCAPDNTILGVAAVSAEEDCVKLYSVFVNNFDSVACLIKSVCSVGKKVEIGLCHKDFANFLETAGLMYQGDDGIWEKNLV